MKKHLDRTDIITFTAVVLLAPIIVWVLAAFAAFPLLNPKANQYVVWTELPAALKFRRVPEYQKEGPR